MTIDTRKWEWLAILAGSLMAGCGSSSTGGSGEGNLSVLLEAEETIVEGIESGDGDENILDGFDVTFSKYIVSIGNVAMSQAGDNNPQSSSRVVIADFASIDDYRTYSAHPEHVRVITDSIKPIATAINRAQFDVS